MLNKKLSKSFPFSFPFCIFAETIKFYFMTFAFYLKDKNSKGKTPLVLIISHNNRKYKKQIGISVRPSDFKKQRVKDETVNSKLRTIENRLNERLNQFSSEEEIKEAIKYALTGEENTKTSKTSTRRVEVSQRGGNPSFWEYFDSWAERESPTKRSRRLAHSNIEKFMGRKDDWEDIDSAFHFRLVKKMNEAGFSINYKWRNIQYLKTVMNEGLKQKFHHNDDFKNWSNPHEDKDAIYLTKDEVDRLWNLDLKVKSLCDTRDLFLLGVYTASRFSDYSRLSSDMIHDGIIHFTQKKTSDSVMIPASPRVLEILERHGGHAPHLFQQDLNERIKGVCQLAGIDSLVEVTHSEGDRHITEMNPKYKLVSTHTARRTGATLLFQSGVPAAQCMMITGHSTEAIFFKYIKTTKEENAKMLKDAAFFK